MYLHVVIPFGELIKGLSSLSSIQGCVNGVCMGLIWAVLGHELTTRHYGSISYLHDVGQPSQCIFYQMITNYIL